MWIPCGVHVESFGVHLTSNQKKEIMWTPCGVHMESSGVYVELWSPRGIYGAG